MERLTALMVRRQQSVLVLTVFSAVVAFVVAGSLSTVLRTGNDDFDDPDRESYRATELIEQRTGEGVEPELSIFAVNLIIALGLGLALDYSLFVLSRYRQEVLEHGYGAAALRRTMATARTATAVLIDATIVRALLPALMALLGGRNWWAPRPLARLHRRLGLAEAT